MANPEHLRILERGVEVWNEWRKKNPSIRPDLNKAMLRDMNLQGAHFMESDLQEADLIGAKLQGAYFDNANLKRSYLKRANLQEAYLNRVDLREADLEDAELRLAHLKKANLQKAHLAMTKLQGAHLENARLIKADLTNAKLQGAHLENARLIKADLTRAKLQGTYFTKAYLQMANLDLTVIQGTDFKFADLSNSRFGGTKFHKYHWYIDGIRFIKWFIMSIIKSPKIIISLKVNLDKFNNTYEPNFFYANIRTIDHSKNPNLKRWIEEQQFIHSLKERGVAYKWICYPIWKVMCDCGRSMFLWIFWSMLIGFSYAFFYYKYGLLSPNISGADIPWKHFLSKLYFSVVTFTTLGFGDLVATTIKGQMIVMSEVIIGYVMLGGLISILANRLIARM